MKYLYLLLLMRIKSFYCDFPVNRRPRESLYLNYCKIRRPFNLNSHKKIKLMDLLYEDKYLLLKGTKKPKAKTCIISFTGVGHAMGGIDVQREEFIGSGLKNGSVFFITDKTRSWANAIDVKKIQTIFSDFGNFKDIVALGNSMGGTNALLLGPALGAQIIISFTPQYSVHPSIIPDLKRKNLMAYRNSILSWKYITAEALASSGVREYIFHGDTPLEALHSNKFKSKDNRVHLILNGCNHDVSMALKSAGILSAVIDLCIHGGSSLDLVDLISSAGLIVSSTGST
jgi:hypothetical protein